MYSIPLVASSSPANGASEVSKDGSSFSLNLETPIKVPEDAVQCWIEVQNAVVWNNSPNILPNVNDKLHISYKGVSYVITLDKGQYDLESLMNSLNIEFEKNNLPRNLIRLKGDAPTQKIIIEYVNLGHILTIDFSKSDTFRDMLGFNSQVILFNKPLAGGSSSILYKKGDKPAKFNSINYFLIHCDLVNLGLRYNAKYSQIISEVLIDAPAGSQLISREVNIPKIPATELIGQSRRNINIWLTDDQNNRLDTNGEYYSFRLTINNIM